ncbi:MAG: hypothetical protein WA790_20155 [Sulfitobacter sp.]
MSVYAVPTAAALTSGPLKFSYPITPLVSLDTVVSGEARNVANVSVVYGSLTLWSGTMMQLAETITIPFDLVAGEITIEKGGTFTMSPPTATQEGSVIASLVIKSSTSTVPFTARIAHWPLDSGA